MSTRTSRLAVTALLFCAFCSAASAQGPWHRQVDDSVLWQRTYCLALDPEGGVVVAGSDDIGGIPRPQIFRLDSTGALSWSMRSDATYAFRKVAVTPAGSIYGTFENGPMHVVKMNSAGTVLWERRLVVGAFDDGPLDGLVPVGADEVVVMHSEYIDFPFSMRLVKLDANGDVVWAKHHASTENLRLTDMVAAPGGGFLCVGWNQNVSDVGAIIRFDANGDELWHLLLDDSDDLHFFGATPVSGGWVVAGFREDAGYDGAIIKVNDAGTVLWGRAYNTGGQQVVFATPHELPDGHLLVTGFEKELFADPNSRIITLETDASGTVLLAEARTDDQSAADALYTVGGRSVMTPSGELVLITDRTAPGANRKHYVQRTTPALYSGCDQALITATGAAFTTSTDALTLTTSTPSFSTAINELGWTAVGTLEVPCVPAPDAITETVPSSVAVYPVPADRTLTLEAAAPLYGRLTLVDALGRTVLEAGRLSGARSEEIDVSSLPPGHYGLLLEGRVLRAVVVE